MFQHEHGHPNLTVSSSGFIVCSAHPFLGASHDGAVCYLVASPNLLDFLK